VGAALCAEGTLESSADDEEEEPADDVESPTADEESPAESNTLESSPVDAEDPVDAVADETELCVAAVAEAVVDAEELAELSNANVRAIRAASVAMPVAMRVRRVEVMAPVVPGDLKISVRVGLRRGEAGSDSMPDRSSPIAETCPGPTSIPALPARSGRSAPAPPIV
jgi:hypothetical protein